MRRYLSADRVKINQSGANNPTREDFIEEFQNERLHSLYRDPDTVTGFEGMPFRDINIEPEGARIVLCRVL